MQTSVIIADGGVTFSAERQRQHTAMHRYAGKNIAPGASASPSGPSNTSR